MHGDSWGGAHRAEWRVRAVQRTSARGVGRASVRRGWRLIPKFLRFAAIAMAGAAIPSTALRAQHPTPSQLNEMIVTATRFEEEAAALPYATVVISREAFEQRSPRTLPDALKEESSVMVQKTSLGQGSPFIRGFTGFRTVLLVDGFRLNNSVFRDGPNQYWNTVDSWSLERIELVKGPTSAQHGSDAIGGTVQARTIAPRFEGEKPVVFAGAVYRFASAEHAQVGRVEAGGGLGNSTGFTLGATAKDFGDLRGGREVGLQPQTGYDERDFDFKLEHRFSPGARLTLAHQAVEQDDVWRTHATIHGLRWKGTRPGSNLVRVLDQRRTLQYARFDVERPGETLRAFQVGAAHQRQAEDEFRQRANLRVERQGFKVNTLGTYAHARWDTKAGRWVTGAEFYRDWVDSHLREFDPTGALAAVRVQGPVADDTRYDLLGIFAENRFPIGARLGAIVGARLNRTRVRAGKVAAPGSGQAFSMSSGTSALAGNARLLAALDREEHWKLFAGASQGVRSPNLSDLTRFDIAEAGQIETPVSQLDPERFVTSEAGLRGNWPRGGVELAYYHTLIDDLIVRTPTGQVVSGLAEVTKRNSGRGYIQGIELEARAMVTKFLAVRGVVTWMEGRLESYPTAAPVLIEEPVSRLMPLTAFGMAHWHDGPWWAAATVTVASTADRLPTQDRIDTERIPPGGTPGYSVYGVRAGWSASRRLTLSAALENVTNEDYRIHGSGLNEPGRNFVFTARVEF
ncbi:MAG: TonB-dependent receptor [Opitutaceae bacterium]|nr:TonB-dependent receptor [Opitutaceae bacterium]